MNDPFVYLLRSLPSFILCGLALSSAIGLAAPVHTAIKTAQTLPTYLSADEKQPAPRDGDASTPGNDRYDFGTRSAVLAAPIEHTFLLRNTGTVSLTVDHIQPSCGCTTALADSTANGAPTIIPPGSQLKVHVSVDPGHLAAGQITKSVWVFLRDQASPAATLLVTGTIQPAASFSPAVLNFGQVKAGAVVSQIVAVTLDPTLVASAPRLISSDPSVVVTSQAAATDAKLRTYTVSLSPKAHLGVLSGSLSLVTATGAGIPAGGQSSSIPIVGTVVGDITASPASVAFGTVTTGQRATRDVTLTGAGPSVLTGLTVRALGPYVNAHLSATATEPGVHRTLEVSVSPKAPPGLVQTQVIVTTAQGQDLVLPVFVYVAKSGTDQ